MVCLPIPPRRQGAKPEEFYSIHQSIEELARVAKRASAGFAILSRYFGTSAGFGAVGTAGGEDGAGTEVGADPCGGVVDGEPCGADGTGMSFGTLPAAGADSITPPPPPAAGRLTVVPA